MTWKIELAALAVTAAMVGGYLHTADLFAEDAVTYHAAFTEADYEAFDRDFELSGDSCDIGLEASNVCLPHFRSKSVVRIGEPLPNDIPALSAGIRVLLALDSKSPELKTVRFGQTLVLIEPETEVVRDLLRLDAPSYASARNPELVGAPIVAAAN